MEKDVILQLVSLIAFIIGLGIRFKSNKSFDKFVDPILLFQALFVVTRLFDFPQVWIPAIVVSFVLAMVLTLLNKHQQYRFIIAALLSPLLIALLASLEHYGWAYIVRYFQIITAIGLTYLILFKTEAIRKELPFLVLFNLFALISVGQLIIDFFNTK